MLRRAASKLRPFAVVPEVAVAATQRRAFHGSALRKLSPLSAVSHEPVFFSSVNVPNPANSSSSTPSQHIPAFRLLDGEGKVLPDVPQEWKDKLGAVPDDVLVKMYKTMIFMPVMDTILSSSQRQGRE